MKFTLQDKLATSYRALRVAFALVKVPAAYASAAEKAKVEARITAAVRAFYPSEYTLSVHPLAVAYEAFYSSVGLNTKKLSTPLKQATRFLTAPYKSKMPLIDSCMMIEYTTLVSFQIFDAQKVADAVTLELASEVSEIVGFGDKLLKTQVGEMSLRCGSGVLHTPPAGINMQYTLGEGSQFALIRLLGIPGLLDANWNAAIAEVKAKLAPVGLVELSSANRSGEIVL